MGHYRSEMGYEEQDRREEAEAAKRHRKLAKAIQKDIEKRGVENVLADIVSDPRMYRMRNY
jgi:hypothetical protein